MGKGDFIMSEEIVIAIIGACGVVLAALIGGIFSIVKNNKDSKSNTKIRQKQKVNTIHRLEFKTSVKVEISKLCKKL